METLRIYHCILLGKPENFWSDCCAFVNMKELPSVTDKYQGRIYLSWVAADCGLAKRQRIETRAYSEADNLGAFLMKVK